MSYFIGIDGGGTNTKFLCLDEKNSQIGSAVLSTAHFMQVREEEAEAVLKRGVREVLPADAGKEEVFLCAGLGGYGKNPEVRQRIEHICARSFEGMEYHICNDGEIALEGALDGNEGILVIAGTGSMGLAKKEGQTLRCGGWGYLLGDEGSAFWMGKKLLEAFCRQNDGRDPETELNEVVKARLGLRDGYELIPYMGTGYNRAAVAELALIVYELAGKGEKTALGIYEEAARHLAELANSLSFYFEGKCPVSYAGSVWKAGDYILLPMRQYLNARTELAKPKHTPVYGACRIAKKMFEASGRPGFSGRHR